MLDWISRNGGFVASVLAGVALIGFGVAVVNTPPPTPAEPTYQAIDPATRAEAERQAWERIDAYVSTLPPPPPTQTHEDFLRAQAAHALRARAEADRMHNTLSACIDRGMRFYQVEPAPRGETNFGAAYKACMGSPDHSVFRGFLMEASEAGEMPAVQRVARRLLQSEGHPHDT